MALASLVALFIAAAAHAESPDGRAIAPACHVSSPLTASASDIAVSRAWRCDGNGWSNAAPKVWLRFDSADWHRSPFPAAFRSHITKVSGATVATVDTSGVVRSRHILPSQLDLAEKGPFFGFPLPEVTDQTMSILVGIEQPHNITVLTEARLTGRSGGAGWTLAQLILVAIVVGVLLAPICFDLAFYTVLRERFVLLHLAMAVGTVFYIVLASNLIGVFVALPLNVLAIAAPLVWALVASMSVYFIMAFLEAGTLPRKTRRILHFAGGWTAIVPGLFALQTDVTQAFDNSGYFLSLGCLIAVICFAIFQALMRGSRAARFLAVAWTPVMIASSERLLHGLGFNHGLPLPDQLLFFALGLEVILIAIGVTDRFMAIRRQRDRAMSDARIMEDLADRDALTGLLNRRAIEPRFANLRQQGFDTVAVIDLDRFKDINDRFGHQTGDSVLRACAAALQGELGRDSIAARLGGEEFMLLLRGRRALDRAEAFRRAITTRIATDVEGLDRPITASMGVIEIGSAGFEGITFAELYARADMLLYEAKEAGRNRTMSEKIQSFGMGRRRARAAA